jgi:hypothetical protein
MPIMLAEFMSALPTDFDDRRTPLHNLTHPADPVTGTGRNTVE